MKLKFVLKQTPKSVDECTEIQVKQLELCAKLYDGVSRPAEAVLNGGEEDAGDCDEGGRLLFLELHDVVDEDSGEVLYDSYLYMVDSGSIFRHNSLEEVAMVIQFGLDLAGDGGEELLQALDEAMAKRERPKVDESSGDGGAWAAYKSATDAAQGARGEAEGEEDG